MIRGLRLTAVAAGLLGACCVGSSSAAQRVSAPLPPLASVLLATGDFAPGGHVASQRAVTLAGLPGVLFDRTQFALVSTTTYEEGSSPK